MKKKRVVSVIWRTIFWVQPTRLFLGTAFVEYVAQALGESEMLLLEQTQFEKRCNGLVIEMNQIMIGAEMYESVCKDRYVISRFYMHFALVACKGTDEKTDQQRKIVK